MNAEPQSDSFDAITSQPEWLTRALKPLSSTIHTPQTSQEETMKTSIFRRASVVPALIALGLAACGSDASDSADTGPMTTDMDMDMDMNMGDPDATPADDVVGAALARGEYSLMDTRPEGYDGVAGTAVIARSPLGTTITTELTGLLPNVDYISHAHAQACDDGNAGPHYQFEVGGSEFPPNEIHLAFTSDNDGNGFMTAENAKIAGTAAVAFVMHPMEFIDNKIACVDFVEDEPGSIDAAIAAGLDESTMDDMDDMDDMNDEG